VCLFFFFQAEDGIRDDLVTGVQTCALPICGDDADAVRLVERFVAESLVFAAVQRRDRSLLRQLEDLGGGFARALHVALGGPAAEIGRASCRERVTRPGVAVSRRRRKATTEA